MDALQPSGPTGSTSLASDAKSFDALRANAARDPKSVVREAARQFEAIFMQQIMKSLRSASVTSGMLDNSGTQMATEMLDTQMATNVSGLGGGLSDVIARQLEKQITAAASPPAAATTSVAPLKAGAATVNVTPKQSEFLLGHQDAARSAEAETGIPAAFMVAQAAHESGWGRHEIKNADGSSTHNLFGIKAGASWKGATAQVTTTEYVDGEPKRVSAKFRAYDSYADAFRDYAKMMKESPRYSQVVANASTPEGFAQGLQRAGYATDPAYADKLTRMINTTLRLQRVA